MIHQRQGKDKPTMCLGKHEYLEVDEEFRRLIPKMNAEEFKQLEANILAVGQITEPIIIWDRIVIDGHHRLKVARKHDLPFHVKRMQFDDNDAARKWMYRNQLGRRNLTDTQRALMLGELYNITKKEHGDVERMAKSSANTPSGQNDHKEKTAEKIGEAEKVSERTVRRAGKLADDVNQLAPAVAEAVVNEEVKATQADVHKLAQLPAKEQARVVEKVKSGKATTVGEAMKPAAKKAKPADAEHWLDPIQEPYEKAAKSIQEASRLVKAIAADEKDGAHLAHLGTFTHIKKNLDEAVQHIKANKPAAGCPKCGDYEIRGKGCKQCYGTGFISAVVHKGLTAKV